MDDHPSQQTNNNYLNNDTSNPININDINATATPQLQQHPSSPMSIYRDSSILSNATTRNDDDDGAGYITHPQQSRSLQYNNNYDDDDDYTVDAAAAVGKSNRVSSSIQNHLQNNSSNSSSSLSVTVPQQLKTLYPQQGQGLSPTAVDMLKSRILSTTINRGQRVYLVAKTWMDSFMVHATNPVILPDPIDNSSLFDAADGKLARDLVASVHYNVLSENDFEELAKGFGVRTAKDVIVRVAIETGRYDVVKVDLSPILVIVQAPFRQRVFVLPFSKHLSTKQFAEEIAAKLQCPVSSLKITDPDQINVTIDSTTILQSYLPVEESTRIIFTVEIDESVASSETSKDFYSAEPVAVVSRKETIEEKRARIKRQQAGVVSAAAADADDFYGAKPQLMLPSPDPDDTTGTTVKLRLSQASPDRTTTSASRAIQPRLSSITLPFGCTGLNNLGNTCFMNSALQCLSNTAPLTAFILSGKWKPELNVDNPLGMNGEVAEAYAYLVHQLWRANAQRTPSVAPRMFKATIGRFNPTFGGYAQQDSQELLQFLLDGLHEDLNRIKKKPYIEVPDMDGHPEHEIAEKSWEIYRARNDSAVVDLFQGEYKSRVECLECGKWSIKFDPYMFLSLPVPERRELRREFVVVSASSLDYAVTDDDFFTIGMAERVKKVLVTVPRDATVKTLKTHVATMMGWASTDSKRVMVCDIFSKRIYKVFDDWDRVAEMSTNDLIYIYELGLPRWSDFEVPEEDQDPSKVCYLPLYFGLRQTSVTYYTKHMEQLFGVPLLIPLPYEFEVTVHVDRKHRIDEKPLIYLCERKLGQILYKQVLRALRRYSQDHGLYRHVQDTQLSGQYLKHLLVTFQRYRGGDDEAPPEDPKLEDRMYPLEGNDLEETPLLFDVKLWRGNQETRTMHDLADFYRTHSHMQSKSEILYPLPEPQSRIPARKPSGEPRSRRRIDVTLAQEPEDQPPPVEQVEADVDNYGDGELTDEDSDECVTISECDRHAQGAVPFTQSFSTRGQLLLVAEFDPMLAEVFFGKDVATASSYSVSKAFTPHSAATESPTIRSDHGSKHAQKNITLHDCINEFMKEEMMGDEDTWYCPQCKTHQKIKKKLDIWRVPEILVFHLKRFSNSGRGFRSISANKIDALVDFPVKGLDLTEIVKGQRLASKYARSKKEEAIADAAETVEAEDDPLIYDLFAVSNHFGGLGGGHYTAYAKNPLSEQWYNFDDSHVSKVSEDSVLTPAAYLLFYQRSGVDYKEQLTDIIEELKTKPVEEPPQQPTSSYNSYSAFPYSHYGGSSGYMLGASPAMGSRYGPPSYGASLASPYTANSPSPSGEGLMSDDEQGPALPFSSTRSSPARLEKVLPNLQSDVGFSFNRVGDEWGMSSEPPLGRTISLTNINMNTIDDEDESTPVHDIILDEGATMELDNGSLDKLDKMEDL